MGTKAEVRSKPALTCSRWFHEEGVQEEREPLSGKKEAEGEESVGDHLGGGRAAEAVSASAQRMPRPTQVRSLVRGIQSSTHLVKLVAEVNGVDVICASGQPSSFEEASGVRSDPPHSRWRT